MRIQSQNPNEEAEKGYCTCCGGIQPIIIPEQETTESKETDEPGA